MPRAPRCKRGDSDDDGGGQWASCAPSTALSHGPSDPPSLEVSPGTVPASQAMALASQAPGRPGSDLTSAARALSPPGRASRCPGLLPEHPRSLPRWLGHLRGGCAVELHKLTIGT